MTDVDRKTKNIVVRCLRPYKGYGLPRERERGNGEKLAKGQGNKGIVPGRKIICMWNVVRV